MKDALLLNLPFVSPTWPAIGISSLKASMLAAGLSCDVGYPNMLFADRVGLQAYNLVDDFGGDGNFVGDWVFARHLFGDALDERAYLERLRLRAGDDGTAEQIAEMRSMVGLFLEECLAHFRVVEYAVIGFSTTFEQNVPSLCLARLIKARYPDKIIVFGGMNCGGEMGEELVRSFPWIDYVCRGESEHTFPALVRALREGAPVEGIANLVHRSGDEVRASPPGPPIASLDTLPPPDYADYFEALSRSRIGSDVHPTMLFEGGRGCWWGAVSHCTFCGFDKSTLPFRRKSGERVYEELRSQREKYGGRTFIAVESIMDRSYFHTLLPRLRAEPLGIELFFEMKSNLREDEVALLRAAGVVLLQLGIESFSTRVLAIMRKGVSALQNIQSLKWCKQHGIEASWNLLFGFPGERAEDYDAMADLLPSLGHLAPPAALARVTLDRFSPYFEAPERYGMTGVRPLEAYALVYALPPERVARLVPFFEYDHPLMPYPYVEGVRERVSAWRREAGKSALTRSYDASGDLLITDTRACRQHEVVTLTGVERQLYDHCDSKRSLDQLCRFLARQATSSAMTQDDLPRFLDRMVALRLMARDGVEYLSLAVGALSIPASETTTPGARRHLPQLASREASNDRRDEPR